MTWVSNSCRLLDFDSKPSRGNRKASSKKSQHYRKLPDSLVRMTILPIEKSLDDDTKMVKAKNQRYSRPWMPNWMLIQRKWQWKNHQHGSWFFPKYMNGFDEHWYLIILSCWNTGSWYVVIHACKDRWIVAKFNDSVDASEIHHKRPRGILSMFIAWLTAFGISFPPERWVSLPPGSPGTPPSPQQRGVLYQDGIVKRLLRCGAEKDMPMQQGLKDLAVQSANQGRTCFFLSLALHNIYEYLYGKHQLFSFGSETWCSMCSMYTLGPSVSLPPFYGIFDWSNFSWRNFIFLCSFYRKVGRRETKQIFRIFGYYPFLHRIFWTHFCSAQLYRNQKRVAENKFTFGFLTLISIIENAQEHTNAY